MNETPTNPVEIVTTPVSYGIKETKEIVKFGIEFGEAFDKALADGKWGFEDAVYFFNAMMCAGPAFKGVKLVPKELVDMDAAERAELMAYVEVEFDIANDKIEMVIEKSLQTVLAIYEIVMMFKGGVKKA